MIGSVLRSVVGRCVVCLLAGVLIFALNHQSFAQDGVDDLNRLNERFEVPEEPRAQFEPTIPEAPDPLTADRIKFALTGVNIEGSTIYSDSELLPLYKDFLGTEVTLSQIFPPDASQ